MDAVLQFTVSNQRIDRTDVFTIVEGSDNYLKAQFSFTADWNGMIKTGVFIDEDGNVHPSLCINDICDVPTEWLVKQRGAVGVIGSDGVTKITTDAVKVRIRDKGYTGEGIDEDSMDGYFDQIMQAFAESQEFVNLKADQAEEAEKSAEAWTHGHEDYPERDQDNAKYYANVTQQNAEQTSGDRSETQRLSEQVSQAERKVSVDKEVVEELKAQVQADAEAALRSEQRAKASETASKENRTGAEAAKGLAEVYAQQTEMDKNTVEQAKADVMQMDQNVAEAKASVEQIVEAFSRTAEQAVTDVKNTGQEQIENIHLAGEKVVGDVENIKAAAVRNIQDEGKIQVQNVQAAAAEIEADRDQIQQNKDEIATLKSEARYDASGIIESASGKLITIDDSTKKPFVNMKIYGWSRQDTTTGSQLLDFSGAVDKTNINGMTAKINGDGSYTLTGTALIAEGNLWLMGGYYAKEDNPTVLLTLPAGTYTGRGVNLYSYQKEVLGINLGSSSAFTITEDTVITGVRNPSLTPGETYNETIYPMLNAGFTALPWEPYTGGIPSPSPDYPQEIVSTGDKGSVEISITNEAESVQTLTMCTSNGFLGIPVTSGGNYTDDTGQQWIANYRDWERGVDVQMVAKEIPQTTFTVRETPDIIGRYIFGRAFINMYKRGNYSCLITHGQYRTYGIYPGAWSVSDSSFYYHPTKETTVEELKEKIITLINSDNPLTFIGQLETPIETPIPPEELAVYRALHSNMSTTTILNDGEVYTEVEYVVDTKTYINKNYVSKESYTALEQRVAALETNARSEANE